MKITLEEIELAAIADSDKQTTFDNASNRRKGFIEGAKWALHESKKVYTGRNDIGGISIYTGDKVRRVTTKEIGVIEYDPNTLSYIFRRKNKTFIRLNVIIDDVEILRK